MVFSNYEISLKINERLYHLIIFSQLFFINPVTIPESVGLWCVGWILLLPFIAFLKNDGIKMADAIPFRADRHRVC